MKKTGLTMMAVGAIAALIGVFVLLVIVPDRAQFPDDVDRMRYYEGELALMLDAEALASGDVANIFIRDVPVTIDRSIETLEVDGGKALVSDGSVVAGPAGPILGSQDFYTIDRKTMEHIENFTDDDRVIDREGLVVGFPIGTDTEDYAGFNGDVLAPNTISFVNEQEHEGLSTYVFSAASGPDMIVDPELLAQFPSELPKAVVEGLVPVLDLPAEATAALGEILPTLPDPIPLAYTYTYETNYWVEPDSGVLVDYNKLESRSVAVNLGDRVFPIAEVMHLEYSQTEDSVADAVADASDARSQLFWQGKVLPYALLVGGVLVALLGFIFFRRPGRQVGGGSPTPSAPRILVND